MATFETVRKKDIVPPDENFEEKIRKSFLHQGVMSALNGELVEVRPGYVEIHLPFSEATRQQHGFFHWRGWSLPLLILLPAMLLIQSWRRRGVSIC